MVQTESKCSVPSEKMIFGTTLFIGSIELETEFGPFTCHTYQNLIHKGYILALTYGDLGACELYTRVHSSCVTSETLGSMDCDCVHQLEGAMKKIAANGAGILFFLIQEGRGCGFVGKARACMMVQYHDDKITTFDAYSQLGMKADYRDYRNIWEVTKLLGIASKSFVLLTNNPDKIRGFQELGMNLSRVEAIEIAPSPFNQSYLVSKQQTGHILHQTRKKNPKYHFPHTRIHPFNPYPLPNASRYIHCASYYLPIQPIDRHMVFSTAELSSLAAKGVVYKLIHQLKSGDQLVQIDAQCIDKVPIQPYWFKLNMYYDIASGCDYVVLSYGDLNSRLPLVRIHSESILNRFPLLSRPYRDKYQLAIDAIVRNECGVIVLLYHDGRGAGLGNYVLNQTQDQTKTGIPVDSRDYKAVAQLLEAHVPEKRVSVLYSFSSRVNLKQALDLQGFTVEKWLQITEKSDPCGHNVISQRIQDAPYYLFNVEIPPFEFSSNRSYIVTGVGSSEAHARYFVNLSETHHPHVNIRFLALTGFSQSPPPNTVVVVVSQGLSPNIYGVLKACNYKNIILLTAATLKNPDSKKRELLERLVSNGCRVINFPLEDEYTTLIRTIGPLAGYYAIYQMLCPPKAERGTEQLLYSRLSNAGLKQPPQSFLRHASQSTPLVILASHPVLSYIQNVAYKFEEGAFFYAVRVAGYLDFAHGVFQNVEFHRHSGTTANFILLRLSDRDDEMIALVEKMLEGRYPVWKLSSDLPGDLQILEIEMIFNHMVLNFIKTIGIDQINWNGQDKQGHLYNWQLTSPPTQKKSDLIDSKTTQHQL